MIRVAFFFIFWCSNCHCTACIRCKLSTFDHLIRNEKKKKPVDNYYWKKRHKQYQYNVKKKTTIKINDEIIDWVQRLSINWVPFSIMKLLWMFFDDIFITFLCNSNVVQTVRHLAIIANDKTKNNEKKNLVWFQLLFSIADGIFSMPTCLYFFKVNWLELDTF